MQKLHYIIIDELGIHAMVAVSLVRETSKYKSTTTISCNGNLADGKDALEIMALGAEKEMEIIITIVGEDEENAVTNLEKFINKNL